MAEGIWATWYDLAQGVTSEARQQFLDWTHEVYCPYLRAQPGYT